MGLLQLLDTFYRQSQPRPVKQKLCALRSNGAAVMLGGVSKLLKEKVLYLVVNHCVPHT